MEKPKLLPKELTEAVENVAKYRKGGCFLIEGMTAEQYLEYMAYVFPDLPLNRAVLYHARSKILELGEYVLEDHGNIFERLRSKVEQWCQDRQEKPLYSGQLISGQVFSFEGVPYLKFDKRTLLSISETFKPLTEQGYIVLGPEYRPLHNL